MSKILTNRIKDEIVIYMAEVHLLPRDDYKEYEMHLAEQFAKMWNNLDSSYIEKYLTSETVYESQWVFSSLKGKKDILNYFNGKLYTVKNSLTKVRAELTTMINIYVDRPCVLMYQDSDEPKVIVLFEAEKARFKRIDMCGVLPTVNDAKKSGYFPK